MMNQTVLSAVLLTAVLLTAAGPASAGDVLPPVLRQDTLDLLPLDDLQMAEFRRENAVLMARVNSLGSSIQKLERAPKAGKGKRKPDAKQRRAADELRGLRVQRGALMVRVTQKLAPYGVDGPLVAYLNRAPTGPGRMERYAYGLILLAPGLEPRVRALFERVVAQLEGQHFALASQQERMALALKQSQLEPADQKALLGTFKRSLRTSDQRFWQLVDCTLPREQRAWVWRRLPGRLKRKAQPAEHLYALPGITPSQATRIKALMTEMEHESSPDKAALKRMAANARSGKKRLTGDERRAANEERKDAYERLTELRIFGAAAIRKILTEEQWLEYEAIPPRVSTNDRRLNFRKHFEGFTPKPEQARKLQALAREMAREMRETNKRAKALKKQGSDYGPDSPQTRMMEMQMMGMRAAGHRAQRAHMGRILLEVLEPQQVSAWVMGRYGYKR